jgi:hypothetical protein
LIFPDQGILIRSSPVSVPPLDAVKPDVPDMIAAVQSAALVEYQLEQVLKQNFHRTDTSTWGRLTDSAGPLRDFHSKIILGHALSSFDENIRINLNIVRDIRNAFAHSRKSLSFDLLEIGSELHKARQVRKGKRILQPGVLVIGPSKRAYLELCMSLLMYFQLKLNDSLKRKERRVRDNIRAYEFLMKLVAARDAKKQ